MSKKISEIEIENEDLKRQYLKMSEMVDKLKSEIKCDKCNSASKTMTHLKNHKTEDQIVKKKNPNNYPHASNEDEEMKRLSCEKCHFTYINQFDLLIHKSVKHPTYILNSQPEAVTGPLH